MNAKLIFTYNENNHFIYKKNYGFSYLKEFYYIDNFKSYKDQIYRIYEINEYFMILFFSKIEIDGLFFCSDSFEIAKYKAEEIYPINCDINGFKIIKKDQYLLYEIKSGGNLESLLNQMKKHYYFISKYFAVFSKYNFENFIYIGFIRDENKINIQSNEIHSFINFKIPIIIIRFFKTFFDENIFYEDVEISDIAEIKYLIEKNTEIVNKRFDNVNNEFDFLKNKLDSVEKEVKKVKNGLTEVKTEIKSEMVVLKNNILQEIKNILDDTLKHLNFSPNNNLNNNMLNISFPQYGNNDSQNFQGNNVSSPQIRFLGQNTPSREESKDESPKKTSENERKQ